MISPDEALKLVWEHALPRSPQMLPLSEACGLQLAEELRADRDYPPFPRAVMDGYAVRLADAGRTVEVVAEVAAGRTADMPVADGNAVEIMTGAPCPPGTQAVVPKEQVQRSGNRVALPTPLPLGQHIAPQGSECRAGAVVLQAGQTLTPLAVAVLASIGSQRVLAIPRPSLAVITTGAELVPPGEQPAPGQIRKSNGPMVLAMARQWGLERLTHLHTVDDLAATRRALETVADRDLILFTGGVSAGNYDFVPAALAGYGAVTIFHHVAQKPGKPLLVARKDRQLIFGLPGNPLACHLGFHRYVTAALRSMQGQRPLATALLGQLDVPVSSQHRRTFFLLAQARYDATAPGGWRVAPAAGSSSADVFGPCHANCYVRIPPGPVHVAAGETVELTWINQGADGSQS
ncbi:MAG: molybdopterin molybdotransferase MoeA [Planctomycetota bacterium]|nr:molybdopterin molybdotransferase MoeA [Planctomycetota bacterium]